MINAKELIIGHFEGTLSSEEARHLDELLETSPEVRAAYDQQRAIEEGMVEDSESLVPPIGLREATIAAAIGGALTTTVGGGITAWLGSKAAAILGTLALGGLVVGGIVLMDDDEPTDAITPATQIEQVQGDERVQEPVVGNQTDNAGGTLEAQGESPTGSEASDPARSVSSSSPNPSRRSATNSDGARNPIDERNNRGDSGRDHQIELGEEGEVEMGSNPDEIRVQN